jgi:hypothetical protein
MSRTKSVLGIDLGRWCTLFIGTNAPSGRGRQSLSVSRRAVPNSNHCIRVGTDRDEGVWPFEAATRTAGVRKERPFADGVAEG